MTHNCEWLLDCYPNSDILSYEFDTHTLELTQIVALLQHDTEGMYQQRVVSSSQPRSSFTYTAVFQQIVESNTPQHLPIVEHMLIINQTSASQWPSYTAFTDPLPYDFSRISRRGPEVYCGWTTSNVSMTIWPFDIYRNHIPRDLRILGTYNHLTVTTDIRDSSTCLFEYHEVKYRIPNVWATLCYIMDNVVYLVEDKTIYLIQLNINRIVVIARLPSKIVEIDHNVVLCEDDSLWEHVNDVMVSVGRIESFWN
jgi:hypothetical protein